MPSLVGTELGGIGGERPGRRVGQSVVTCSASRRQRQLPAVPALVDKTRLTRRFDLPPTASLGGTPLPERDRTTMLGHVPTDRAGQLRSWIAAAILLLHAQPVSRLTRLTIDDIIRNGDQVLLRLGDPPSSWPARPA